MYVSHAVTVRVLSSTFSNNTVNGERGRGGGLFITSGSGCNMSTSGAEVGESTGCSVQLSNSTFEDNAAKGYGAGAPAAFFVLNGFQILISKCTFASHLAAHHVKEDPTTISSRGAVHMEANEDPIAHVRLHISWTRRSATTRLGMQACRWYTCTA